MKKESNKKVSKVVSKKPAVKAKKITTILNRREESSITKAEIPNINVSSDVVLDFNSSETLPETNYNLSSPLSSIEQDVKEFEEVISSKDIKRKPSSYKTKVFLVVSVLAILIIIGVSVREKKVLSEDVLIKNILADVSQLIIVSDEEPAIAVVEKPEELAKTDNFYRNSVVGDYVLIYNDRAILYDPKSKKIRLAIPLSIENPSSN